MTRGEAETILNYYNQNLSWYGHTFSTRMRSNKQIPLQDHPIYNSIKEIISRDIQNVKVDWEPTEWISLIEYVKGDFFNVHTDDYGSINNKDPKLLFSGGYLLNDKFEGGSFFLNGKRQNHRVGELFYFKRDEPHQVETITSGKRYALHFGIQKKTSNKLLI